MIVMPAKKSKKSKGNQILTEEKKIEQLEQKELKELVELRQEVEKKVITHPLSKITKADIVRSFIGALIGTIGHFAFFYGVELADKISIMRATSLYVLSAVVAFFFMYYSGFRKVKEVRIFRFIPVRVLVVYLISLIVVLGTLFIFGFIDGDLSLIQIYKTTATTLMLAVLGASTADILGKD